MYRDGATSIRTVLVNYGQTPALDYRTDVRFLPLPLPPAALPSNFEFDDRTHVLFPSVESHVVHSVQHYPKELWTQPAPTVNGHPHPTNLYLYGALSYSDIFGHHHTTKFCFVWSAEQNRFLVCAGYSDAD